MTETEGGGQEDKTKKASGKWAAEIYDIFRLFSRLNNTIYGLLLLEAGWLLFVIMIGKLPSDSGRSTSMS